MAIVRRPFVLIADAQLLRFDVRSCGVSRSEGRDDAAPTLRLLSGETALQVLGRLAHAGNNEELVQTVMFLSAADEGKTLGPGDYVLEFEASPPPPLKPDTGMNKDVAFDNVRVTVVSGEAEIVPPSR